MKDDYTTQRLDRYIRRKYGQIPQSLIEKAIRNKDILLNGKKAKSSDRVSDRDDVYIHPNIERLFADISISQKPSKQVLVSNQQKAEFKKIIIYEDDDLLIVNKPAGMAVQLGSKTNIALDVIAREYNPELRLVHRIDKETSGLTIFAKNAETARYMLQQFKTKQIKKTYVALLSKKALSKSFTVREKLFKDKDRVVVDPVRGKEAVTQIILIKNFSGKSLVYANPLTGRTHQIRVHLSSLGCPVFGDEKYGGKTFGHLCLHSYQVSLKKRGTDSHLTVSAPLPDYFGCEFNV